MAAAKLNDDDAEEIIDTHSKNPMESPLLDQLLTRMHPSQCLECSSSILLLDETSVLDIAEPLVHDVRCGKNAKSRSVALQQLQKMTDRQHKEQRMALVCTNRFSLVEALVPLLSTTTSDTSTSDRRRVLLIVTNLAVPVENKAVMLLTDTATSFIAALLSLIEQRTEDCYLAAACLFNLSFLEDTKPWLLLATSSSSSSSTSTAADHKANATASNPHYLLRILEQLLTEYIPYLSYKTHSVQSQATQWSMGILRNLVTNVHNATLVATQSTIPALAVQCLYESRNDISLWSRDTVEDAALMVLVHLLATGQSLVPTNIPHLFEALTKVLHLQPSSGIHALRAQTLLQQLQWQAQQEAQESNEI